MKKRLAYFITAVWMITVAISSISCLAAENTHRFDDSGTPFLYASNDEWIWIVRNERVSVYNLDLAEQPVAEYTIDPADHIYANSDGLYICRASDHSSQIVLFDLAGNMVNSWTIPEGVYIQQFIVMEDNILAVVCGHAPANEAVDAGAGAMLYRFSMEENAGGYVMDSPVYAIAAGEQGNVLCLYEDEASQYAVGVWPATLDGMTASYPLMGAEFTAILSCEQGCCLLSEMGIHRLDFSSGEMTLWYPMEQGQAHWRGLQRAGGFILTEDFAAGTLKRFDMDTSEEAEGIRLVNLSKYNDQRINAAIRLFRQAHPDTEVSFVDLDSAKLSTALMANEAGYDILAANDYELAVYRESGILEDLSDCAGIWAALEHWNEMPYLMNPHKDALPLYVLPKVYSLNEGAQDLAEVFPEQPGSWAELFACAAELPPSDGRSLLWGSKRFPEVYDQYLAWCAKEGAVDFDTALFRDEMLQFKKAYDDGVIVDGEEYDGLLIPSGMGVYPPEGSVVPYPMLNVEMIYPCQTYSIAVSKTSAQTELAQEFLSCYASVEAQRAADVNTMAAGFLKDPALYACADPDMGYPTQEQASLYARILKYAASAPYNLGFNL